MNQTDQSELESLRPLWDLLSAYVLHRFLIHCVGDHDNVACAARLNSIQVPLQRGKFAENYINSPTLIYQNRQRDPF